MKNKANVPLRKEIEREYCNGVIITEIVLDLIIDNPDQLGLIFVTKTGLRTTNP